MTTKHPRVHVTLDETVSSHLNFLAKKEDKSLSKLIYELTKEALELREDQFLSSLSMKRDEENHVLVSHEEAWGRDL